MEEAGEDGRDSGRLKERVKLEPEGGVKLFKGGVQLGEQPSWYCKSIESVIFTATAEEYIAEGMSFAPINHPPPPTPAYTDPSTFSPDQSLQPQSPTFLAHAPRGKVAIPALKPPQTTESSQGSKKGRTSHACDFCRKAKAGCTGGQPCMRCKNANVACVYGDGKRDRDRKKLSVLSKETITLSQYNSNILDALRRIQQDTSLSPDSIRTAIDSILSITPTPVSEKDPSEAAFGSSQVSPGLEEDSGGEQDASEIGSTGSLDVVNVDTDRDENRATGHMGKASAVAWAKRTAEEYETKTLQESTLGTHQTGYTLASYHTEDADVEFIDLSTVNAFDWPDYEMADALVRLYFDKVHNTFPLLDRQDFAAKYDTFSRGSANLSMEDGVWLGMLNLVFAIGAVYSQLSRQQDRGQHHDHLIYLKRAKMLCLDQDFLFQDARVSTARVLGLLCLYFVSTCRLNRAWTICGLAIRHALTLGLQVRSHAEGLNDYEKEQRVRLWWSLYTLECLLNELTGRPSCISDQDISSPLPMNINEDALRFSQSIYSSPHISEPYSRRASRGSRSSDTRPTATYQMPTGITQPLIYKFPALSPTVTTSTYFIYRLELCIISHEIVTQLYCAATTKAKWSEVQDAIRRIDKRLISWRDNLPEEFSISFDEWTAPNFASPNILDRLGLAMLFNSSRMILFRPCLCRFERRVKTHSKISKDFNHEAAKICVHSARTMISLVHWSASSVEKLYSITPWWNTLHYLCEALSVLMLEMAFQAQHLPGEAAYILDDAKNGIRWLRMMAGDSVSARKAWEIFDCLIRLVAPMINWSVYDLPTEAPIPPGYNWKRFNAAGGAIPSDHHLQNQEQEKEQLSEANLQQYQVNQANVDPTAATSAWNQDQTFPQAPAFTSAPHPGPGLAYEQIGNPLDHTTAVERFGSIGRVHGHYDEPWQHMFVSGLGLGMGDVVDNMGMGQAGDAMFGQQGFEDFGGQAAARQEGYQSGTFGF
ncbi:hypothetical protein EG329_001718 [Mollisiaceae sp. DMI_Dod_QoI]|nr:hypothetical protein EG329_001718 [Helotiales sp. DMI_Dod_QoI]